MATSTEQSTPSAAIGHAWLWLLVIVGLALGLRLWRSETPFQQDEFGSLYAVAERSNDQPGYTPSPNDALLPVVSCHEVRARSVLPYGIRNPVPLYHYILHETIKGTVKVLGAERGVEKWMLRLPSLLAGMGCVIGMYFVCRRFLGAEVGLAAALLTAVDPMQITISAQARPYALGSLGCVLSFVALSALLYGRRQGVIDLAAVGYSLLLAFIGYLQPIMLMVGVAHLALVGYWYFARVPATIPGDGASEDSLSAAMPRARFHRVLAWMAGCVAAGFLLWPMQDYIRELRQFSQAHQDYLNLTRPDYFEAFLAHNSTFLIALLTVTVGGYIIGEMMSGQDTPGFSADATQSAPADPSTLPTPRPAAEPQETLSPPPESPYLVWLGRTWLLLPLFLTWVLAMFLHQPMFMSRYLSYTPLGGIVILAYWATRGRSRDMNLVVTGIVALSMVLWGFWGYKDWGRGDGSITTDDSAQRVVAQLNSLEDKGRWQDGDVILLRSGFLEGDFLPGANRAGLEGAIAATLTTLYVPDKPKPFIVLSLSHRRDDYLQSRMGPFYDPRPIYNEELAQRIRPFQRFWIRSSAWHIDGFMKGLLPWLADALAWDLKVARNRPDPEHYFDVYTDIQPAEFVAGLSDARPSDFTNLILVRRRQPQGIGMLGAVSGLAQPNGYISFPVWLTIYYRTPRPIEKPDARDEIPATPISD